MYGYVHASRSEANGHVESIEMGREISWGKPWKNTIRMKTSQKDSCEQYTDDVCVAKCWIKVNALENDECVGMSSNSKGGLPYSCISSKRFLNPLNEFNFSLTRSASVLTVVSLMSLSKCSTPISSACRHVNVIKTVIPWVCLKQIDVYARERFPPILTDCPGTKLLCHIYDGTLAARISVWVMCKPLRHSKKVQGKLVPPPQHQFLRADVEMTAVWVYRPVHTNVLA